MVKVTVSLSLVLKILLEDSKEVTGFVIVVKIENLAAGDQEIKEGYVELQSTIGILGKETKLEKDK